MSSLFVGQLAARGLALAFYVVLARVLTPEHFGDFAVAVAFGTLFAIPIEPGLNPQVIREGARDPIQRRAYMSAALLYKILAVPPLFGLLVGASWLLDHRGAALLGMALVGGAVLLSQIDEYVAAVLAAFERLDISAGLRVINKVLTAAAAGAVALFTGSFEWICATYAIGALLAAAIGLLVIHLKLQRFDLSLRRAQLKPKIVAGLPLALSYSLSMGAVRLDQAMASMFGVPTALIGGYNAAVKLKEALYMVPQVVSLSFTPVLSRLLDDRDAFRESLARALHWGLGGSVPIALGVWVLAEPLLSLVYGAPYAVYGDLMRLVFVAFVMSALLSLFTALAIARRAFRLPALSSAVTLIATAILNAALLPTLGIQGAGIALATSTALGAAILASQLPRAGCTGLFLAACARTLIASAPMVVAVSWLGAGNVVIAVLAGAAIYCPIYVAIGGLGPGGLRALKERLGRA